MKKNMYLEKIRFLLTGFCILLAPVLLQAQDVTLRVENTSGSVYVNIGANAKLNISSTGNTGGIHLGTGGAIDNSGNIELAGKWMNNGNGLVNGNPGKVVFDFNATQAIQGSAVTTFYDLIVNNPTGVSLTKPTIVTHSLILTSGVLSIGSNSLTVNGAVTGTGTISGSSNSSLIIGGSAGTLNFTSGSGILKSLTLNTGATATLGTALDITAGSTPGTVIVNSGATLNSAGNLRLKSDLNGTAMVGNSAGAITGDVTVERFIGAATPKSAWRLMTAPLRSTTGSNVNIFSTWQDNGGNNAGIGTQVTGPGGASATTGIDLYTPRPSIQYFNFSVDQNLHGVSDTKSLTANPLFTTASSAANKSFFIFTRGDRSVSPGGTANNTLFAPKGALQLGDQTFATAATAANDNTLVGNPYASPVDLNLFRQGNLNANIKSTYYYWDPYLTGAYGVGGYVTVSYDLAGNETITPSGATHTRFLQSGQAMFLERLANVTGKTAAVTFKEDQKASTNAGIFGPTSVPENMIVNIDVMVANSPVMVDGIVAAFDNSYSADVDDYDATKFFNVGESIAFSRNGYDLSIERRPTIVNRDTLFLKMKNMVAGNSYRFEFAPAFSNPLLTAFLQDSYVPGSSIPVSTTSNSSFDFTVTTDPATAVANRFRIVFGSSAPLAIGFTSVKAYRQNQNIAVEWTVGSELNANHYEVEYSTDGTGFNKLTSINATGNNNGSVNYSYLHLAPVQGMNYYRIKGVENSGAVKYSSIVKVALGGKGNPGILVYPNPVVGNTASLQLRDLAAGQYTIQLINGSGQLVSSQAITHGTGTTSHSLSLPASISNGMYRIVVYGADGEKYITTVNIAGR